MGFNSLRSRLLMLSALLLCALMLSLAWFLSELFYGAQITQMREQLRLHSHSILAAAEYKQGELKLPASLAEPLFNKVNSGLYAQLVNQKNSRTWYSQSAQAISPLGQEWAPVGEWRYSMASRTDDGGELQTLFVARFGVQWGQLSNDQNTQWNLILMRDMNPLLLRIEQFKKRLAVVLLVLSALLIAVQLAVLKWGLKPLNFLALDLQALQRGEQKKLEGRYPKELTPLTSNLNRLIESERQQRERYRNSLADLSHSLKTPLTVASGIVDLKKLSANDQHELALQLQRMSQIIQYQLQRSVIGAQSMAFERVPVSPVVKSLVNALSKVYAGQGISITTELDADCCFYGDENDLIEIVGNLMDNACKYGAGHVLVITRTTQLDLQLGWQLVVEDNGAGVDPKDVMHILQRGVRLDTLGQSEQVGQGLGLALVKDIVAALGATINVDRSEVGGCRFVVDFISGSEKN